MHFIIQKIFPLKILATSALQSNCVNVILFQVILLLSTKNVRNMGFNLLNPHPHRNTLLGAQKIVNILKSSLKIPESINVEQVSFWVSSNITGVRVEKKVIVNTKEKRTTCKILWEKKATSRMAEKSPLKICSFINAMRLQKLWKLSQLTNGSQQFEVHLLKKNTSILVRTVAFLTHFILIFLSPVPW